MSVEGVKPGSSSIGFCERVYSTTPQWMGRSVQKLQSGAKYAFDVVTYPVRTITSTVVTTTQIAFGVLAVYALSCLWSKARELKLL